MRENRGEIGGNPIQIKTHNLNLNKSKPKSTSIQIKTQSQTRSMIQPQPTTSTQITWINPLKPQPTTSTQPIKATWLTTHNLNQNQNPITNPKPTKSTKTGIANRRLWEQQIGNSEIEQRGKSKQRGKKNQWMRFYRSVMVERKSIVAHINEWEDHRTKGKREEGKRKSMGEWRWR